MHIAHYVRWHAHNIRVHLRLRVLNVIALSLYATCYHTCIRDCMFGVFSSRPRCLPMYLGRFLNLVAIVTSTFKPQTAPDAATIRPMDDTPPADDGQDFDVDEFKRSYEAQHSAELHALRSEFSEALQTPPGTPPEPSLDELTSSNRLRAAKLVSTAIDKLANIMEHEPDPRHVLAAVKMILDKGLPTDMKSDPKTIEDWIKAAQATPLSSTSVTPIPPDTDTPK